MYDKRMSDERPPGLTRLTVNLTPRSALALDFIIQVTADSKTDGINEALPVYARLLRELGPDAAMHVVALVECWREKNASSEAGRV